MHFGYSHQGRYDESEVDWRSTMHQACQKPSWALFIQKTRREKVMTVAWNSSQAHISAQGTFGSQVHLFCYMSWRRPGVNLYWLLCWELRLISIFSQSGKGNLHSKSHMKKAKDKHSPYDCHLAVTLRSSDPFLCRRLLLHHRVSLSPLLSLFPRNQLPLFGQLLPRATERC